MPRYVRDEERIARAIDRTRRGLADVQRPTGTERRRTAVVAEEAAVEASNAWDAASSAVKQIVTEYAVGSSETIPPTSGWSTSSPTRTPGSYIWMRSTITYGDDTTSTLSPVLVTGNDGAEGPQGVPGAPGEPGEDGAPGATTYTWIRYADTSAGGGISNDPTGKAYIGFAYNKTTPTESNTPGDYTWSLIKGPQGDQGVPGEPGDDGTTTYTWIKYADVANGSGMYDTPTSSTKYIGIAVNKTTPAESTNPADYTWSQFRGNDGADGADGADGRGITSTSISYQASASGTTIPTGTWNPTIPTVPAGQFLWTRTITEYTTGSPSTAYSVARQGANGSNGTPGAPGDDGQTSYLHVAYASNSTGTSNFSTTDPSGRTYVGTYTDFTEADSTNPALYTWALFKGADGSDGAPGTPGKGISSTVITYQAGTSGTSAPTGTWSGTIPSVPAGQFLWTRTVITFTDSATTTTYSVARQGANGSNGSNGADGVSVSSVTQYYQTTASTASAPAAPTTLNPPSPPWYATEPAYTAGTALWSVVRVVYSNGTFAYSAVSKVSAFTAAVLADGKLTVATANPTTAQGTGKPVGALWMVKISGELTRMYEWNGTAWVLTPLAETIIPKVAIGEGTYGDLVGRTLTGNLIRTAASGLRVQLDSVGLRTFSAAGAETSRLSADAGGLLLSGALSAWDGSPSGVVATFKPGLVQFRRADGASTDSLDITAGSISSNDSNSTLYISKATASPGVGLTMDAGVGGSNRASISMLGYDGGSIHLDAGRISFRGDEIYTVTAADILSNWALITTGYERYIKRQHNRVTVHVVVQLTAAGGSLNTLIRVPAQFVPQTGEPNRFIGMTRSSGTTAAASITGQLHMGRQSNGTGIISIPETYRDGSLAANAFVPIIAQWDI